MAAIANTPYQFNEILPIYVFQSVLDEVPHDVTQFCDRFRISPTPLLCHLIKNVTDFASKYEVFKMYICHKFNYDISTKNITITRYDGNQISMLYDFFFDNLDEGIVCYKFDGAIAKYKKLEDRRIVDICKTEAFWKSDNWFGVIDLMIKEFSHKPLTANYIIKTSSLITSKKALENWQNQTVDMQKFNNIVQIRYIYQNYFKNTVFETTQLMEDTPEFIQLRDRAVIGSPRYDYLLKNISVITRLMEDSTLEMASANTVRPVFKKSFTELADCYKNKAPFIDEDLRLTCKRRDESCQNLLDDCNIGLPPNFHYHFIRGKLKNSA